MDAVAAEHTGILRHGLPVDDGDVVELAGELADRLVHLGHLRPVERHGVQHRRAGGQAGEDHPQLSLVALLIAAVVGPEEHRGDVPVVVGARDGVDDLVDHPVAEIDELAPFGLDLNGPAERDELVAHVRAVPGGGAGHDRIADHQHPVADRLLTDQLGGRAVVAHRAGDDHQRAAFRRHGRREHAHATHRRQRCRRNVGGLDVGRRATAGARRQRDRAGGRDEHRWAASHRPIEAPRGAGFTSAGSNAARRGSRRAGRARSGRPLPPSVRRGSGCRP